MTKYREILRLTALGLSQRNIIQKASVFRRKPLSRFNGELRNCIYPGL